jgi:DNA modification methylase
MGADLSMLGFSDKQLTAALSTGAGGLTDENEVPTAADAAVSAPGDIWRLGSRRIVCGNSTNADQVKALFAGVMPQLMVTDPPYGVEYDPERRHRIGVKSQKRGKIQNDGRADWAETRALFPGEIAYVWQGALHAGTVAESVVKTGFSIRAQIVWAKERLVMSRGDYHWQHEPCWYAVRKKGNWSIPTGGQDIETKHSTQKPVECMRRPIVNNSDPGQALYEPFLGSGTTLIAAHSTGRVCYGVEIDPIFIDVVIRRWQAFTGDSAVREGDSRSFHDLQQGLTGRLLSAPAEGL